MASQQAQWRSIAEELTHLAPETTPGGFLSRRLDDPEAKRSQSFPDKNQLESD